MRVIALHAVLQPNHTQGNNEQHLQCSACWKHVPCVTPSPRRTGMMLSSSRLALN